jgi:hypothetical protein
MIYNKSLQNPRSKKKQTRGEAKAAFNRKSKHLQAANVSKPISDKERNRDESIKKM